MKETKIIKTSKLIETKPLGGPRYQPKFLNAALKITTNLPALILLKKLKKIEQELGRPKKHIRFGPRTIDLDILFYADKVIKTRSLIIPHRRVFKREFVIKPLLELL